MLFITYSTVLMEYACINTRKSRASSREKLLHCLHAYHKTHLHTMNVSNTRSLLLLIESFLLKILCFSATEIFSCFKVINAFNSWADTFMKSSRSFALMHSALENFCTPLFNKGCFLDLPTSRLRECRRCEGRLRREPRMFRLQKIEYNLHNVGVK